MILHNSSYKNIQLILQQPLTHTTPTGDEAASPAKQPSESPPDDSPDDSGVDNSEEEEEEESDDDEYVPNRADKELAPDILEEWIEPENHSFQLAEVVFITEYEGRNRKFVVTLVPNRKDALEGRGKESSIVKEEEKFVKAVPVDKKYPWILIRLTEEVQEQLKVPGKLNRWSFFFNSIVRRLLKKSSC